jgi:hypothetical protein
MLSYAQRRLIMPRLTTEQKDIIIAEYRDKLTPMEQLGIHFGVSRQAIHKLLKKRGVDTSKHRIPVPCHCCGKETLKAKSQIRDRKNHFCSIDCYYAWVDSRSEGPYVQNRTSQRLARFKISQVFDLQPSHVVHHINRDTTDNALDNLIVFASQADHIRHHRGLPIPSLWGKDVRLA